MHGVIKYPLPQLPPWDRNKRALGDEDPEGVISRSHRVIPQVLIRIQALFRYIANLAHLPNYTDYEIAWNALILLLESSLDQ